MKLRSLKEGITVLAVITLIIAQASCYYPKTSPGWEYMPDMANAITYETHSPHPFFPDSMGSRQPVPGTIPRGAYEPFHFSSNPVSGYDSAGLLVHFPSWLDSNSIGEGSHIFNIYCAVCHGFGGKGDGSIVNNANLKNPFPPVPSYFDSLRLSLPEGKMYHSVHYGKNLMGPYSKILDHNEVWKVVYYVKNLQNNYRDSVRTAATKAAAAPAATANADTTRK